MADPSPVVEVAAAIIRDSSGRYLIVRRRRGTHLEGLWEFPGGKRETGESIVECLRRELIEELAATVAVEEKIATIPWDYGERTVILHFFRCRLEIDMIAPREGQDLAWVPPERLGNYAFPPADAELVACLMKS